MYMEMLNEIRTVLSETTLYDDLMDEESNDFLAAIRENHDREIYDDVPFPVKDRETRANRRKARAHKVNHRKEIYAAVTGGEPEKPGKLAKGKGITHLPRGWKWRGDAPSMSQYRAETAAREAERDFVSAREMEDLPSPWELYEDDDIEYGDDLGDEWWVEEIREEITARIYDIETAAEAIEYAALLGKQIERAKEYGPGDDVDVYEWGIRALMEKFNPYW